MLLLVKKLFLLHFPAAISMVLNNLLIQLLVERAMLICLLLLLLKDHRKDMTDVVLFVQQRFCRGSRRCCHGLVYQSLSLCPTLMRARKSSTQGCLTLCTFVRRRVLEARLVTKRCLGGGRVEATVFLFRCNCSLYN